MRRLASVLLLLAALAPQAARAQFVHVQAAPATPALVPTRDAVLGYHLSPATGEAIDVRVALRAGGKALRMDLPDHTYMLAVMATRSLTLVVPLERTALELPWTDGPQPLFTLDDKARYTKKGDATIAGQKCTNWDSIGERGRATVCVTPDGVILRSTSVDAMGRRNLVEAFAIRYEALADSDFLVPQTLRAPRRSPAGGAQVRFVLLAALSAAAPAMAQPAPRTQPTRDVVVTYRVEGEATSRIPGGLPGPVRLSWDAAGQRVRAEAEGRSQVALLDLRNRTATGFDTGLRVTLPMPIRPSDIQPLTLENARLTPRGRDTVAGIPCTLYAIEGRSPGTVCLSADGVPLKGQGDIDGRPGRFTALTVAYGPLPPSLFTVPPGYMALDGIAGRLGGAGGVNLRDLLGGVR